MKNEERIIKKLLEHDDRFEQMDEKIDNFRQEYLEGQEQMITNLKCPDEERIFTTE